jgi:hypothetical protein
MPPNSGVTNMASYPPNYFADCRAALTNGDGQDDDELEAKAADGVTYQNCCAASRLGPTDAN